MRYIWENVIKNKPVEDFNAPMQQDVEENYNDSAQRNMVENYYNYPVQQDSVENINALVQKDAVVDEEIAQSVEDLDHRSMFVDGTSLDFVYWNSYVPNIK